MGGFWVEFYSKSVLSRMTFHEHWFSRLCVSCGGWISFRYFTWENWRWTPLYVAGDWRSASLLGEHFLSRSAKSASLWLTSPWPCGLYHIVKEPDSGHLSIVPSFAVKGASVAHQCCCYSYWITPTAVSFGEHAHLLAQKCTASGNIGMGLQIQQV